MRLRSGEALMSSRKRESRNGAGLSNRTAQQLRQAGARQKDVDAVVAGTRRYGLRLPTGELRRGRMRRAYAATLVRASAAIWRLIERIERWRDRLEAAGRRR